MSQSVIAGLLLVLFGVIVRGNADAVWKVSESWKHENGGGPSTAFEKVCRIIGILFVFVGILLVLGLVH